MFNPNKSYILLSRNINGFMLCQKKYRVYLVGSDEDTERLDAGYKTINKKALVGYSVMQVSFLCISFDVSV